MIREFTLEELPNLEDGRVLEAWKQALQRVARDCEDRPALDKERKLILELSLAPRLDDDGQLREVKGKFKVKEATPTRESSSFSLDVRRSTTEGKANQRMLVFNDMSEDNVNQRTIDEMEEEE